MSGRFRVVLALACGTLAVVACLAYAERVRADAEQVRSEAMERYGGEVVELVVAEQALEAGDVVSERNVRVREWLADLAPAEALTSIDDLVGTSVSVPVAQGAPLTKLNFRTDDAVLEAPSGHVAVSVPLTDKLGVSREVAPGSNLIAYRTHEGSATLLASGLEVLSLVGDRSTSIVLAVSPDDVALVLAASASGDLRLVVPADDVVIDEASQAPTASTSVAPETTQRGDAS
jgi:pilus assembly protein CpaB